jgi:hypothetical protein
MALSQNVVVYYDDIIPYPRSDCSVPYLDFKKVLNSSSLLENKERGEGASGVLVFHSAHFLQKNNL